MLFTLGRIGCLAVLALSGIVALSELAMAQVVSIGCPQSLVRDIPPLRSTALSGMAFTAQVASLSGAQRDTVIKRVLVAGNIPEFMRHLIPVTLEGRLSTGKTVSVTVCVMPDYLAIGSDADFVRVPMGLPAAVSIANQLGFMLPTTKIVDAIYTQADVRVPPEPMEPSPEMRSTAYFARHNSLVRQEMLAEGATLGMLLAGQKKDLVLTERLRTHPGKVAIYGWHRQNGIPIQPLSTVHGENYADYSHGVRLVSAIAYVNNEERSLLDILQDPELAPIISSEGSIPNAGALFASLDVRGIEAPSIQLAAAYPRRARSARNASAH